MFKHVSYKKIKTQKRFLTYMWIKAVILLTHNLEILRYDTEFHVCQKADG